MRRDSTLFEKCIERVSVGAEVAEMLSGATLGELASAPAFVVAKETCSLQVSHDRGVAVRQRL